MRNAGGYLLISFDGIDTREEASLLRNAVIKIDASAFPELKEGEYYHHQIIGLPVFTIEGREIGTVTEIIATGGNDVYCISSRGKELLIPAIKDLIESIDLSAGKIIIRSMEGLTDS